MRRILVAWTIFVSTMILASALWGQDFKFESSQIKDRQKAEMKALKLKHKYAKDSMKGQPVPKSMRIQMQHEMKREEKALRSKHEDEREKLKDLQRVMKESQGA